MPRPGKEVKISPSVFKIDKQPTEQELVGRIKREIECCPLGEEQLCPYEADCDTCTAERILDLIKEVYPIMYQEDADFVVWLLDRGWIPPEEVKMAQSNTGEER